MGRLLGRLLAGAGLALGVGRASQLEFDRSMLEFLLDVVAERLEREEDGWEDAGGGKERLAAPQQTFYGLARGTVEVLRSRPDPLGPYVFERVMAIEGAGARASPMIRI